MALIKKPPARVNLWDKKYETEKVEAFLTSPEFTALVQKANENYWHWHAFRHRPLPDGVEPEVAWTVLRLGRGLNFRPAPFSDVKDQPFMYWLPSGIQKNLHFVDRHAGRFFGSESTSPKILQANRERYVVSALMNEAISSSQLEGAATTRREAKAMLCSGRRPRNKSERMIANNWQTMQHLCESRSEPLSPDFIKRIHSMITDGTLDNAEDAGRLRTSDDIHIVDMRDGETIHTPPPHGVLPSRLQALCDFANNDDEENWIHPVVKAVMLHFWLAYDHPFVDGNGRTARALFYWYLLSRDYWLFEYLSISRYFLRAPIQYANAFQETETDGGDLTYFLNFNLRVVRLALQDLHLYLETKQREAQERQAIGAQWNNLNERQRELLADALKNPESEYTIASYQRFNFVAYGTARADLLGLVERGLFVKRQRGRAFVFAPTPDFKAKYAK